MRSEKLTAAPLDPFQPPPPPTSVRALPGRGLEVEWRTETDGRGSWDSRTVLFPADGSPPEYSTFGLIIQAHSGPLCQDDSQHWGDGHAVRVGDYDDWTVWDYFEAADAAAGAAGLTLPDQRWRRMMYVRDDMPPAQAAAVRLHCDLAASARLASDTPRHYVVDWLIEAGRDADAAALANAATGYP